jgi:hypothetical protein
MFVFFGRCNDVLAYPRFIASYAVSVRQYRILPFDFLQCMGHPKPPCHLLILPGVTPVYKGLTPSGKIHSFLVSLCIRKFVFSKFFKSLQRVRAAYAGRTHAFGVMRGEVVKFKFSFSIGVLW